MGVHGLAGDEQAHDFGGALEDRVDAHVTQISLDGVRRVSAREQRGVRLVAAASSDLQRVVYDAQAGFRCPQLGDRGFESNVEGLRVGHSRCELDHRLHCEGFSGHPAEHLCDGVVLAYLTAPLNAGPGPISAHLERAFARRGAERGQRQASGVQRDERELQSLALCPQQILAWHLHIGEAKDSVGESVEPHKGALAYGLDALPLGLHDQRGDRLAARSFGRWRARHDYDDVGAWPVRRPQLLAVQDPMRSILGERRGRGHVGGVRSHVGLGERER